MSKLFVESVGEGPDLVLLHGWGLHGGIWQTVVPELAKQYRVHCVDMPGFGHSKDYLLEDGKYTLFNLTDVIAPYMPEGARVMGWSLGGLVALDLADRYPEKVSQLLNIASSPKFVNQEAWRCAMNPQLLADFSEALQQDYQATLQRFLAIQTLGAEHAKEDIKLLNSQLFERGEPSQQALREGLTILQQADLREAVARITVPQYWMFGRLDALVPIKTKAAVGQLCEQATTLQVDKASHAPFISHRTLFVDTVLSWLSEQSA